SILTTTTSATTVASTLSSCLPTLCRLPSLSGLQWVLSALSLCMATTATKERWLPSGRVHHYSGWLYSGCTGWSGVHRTPLSSCLDYFTLGGGDPKDSPFRCLNNFFRFHYGGI